MQANRQVELYYWSGDNPNFSGTAQWTKAVNVDGKNAIISVDFEHKLNSPAKAGVVLINLIPNYKAADIDSHSAWLSVLPSGSDSGTASPLFTDFMRVALIDAQSKLVLLYGRLYDIQQEYNNYQGMTTTLEIRDELEILRGLYVDEIGDVDVTSSDERSDVIKDSLISAAAWAKPSEVDIKIAIDDTGTNPENRLQTSAGTYPATDTLRYSRSGSNVLQEIANIAVEDPQSTEDSDKIAAIYGYDFYLDSNFASVDNNGDDTRTPPSAHFNYFKRGDRPNNGEAPGTYGLSVELPTATFAKTGHTDTEVAKVPMLSNFDFERPKHEIFTDATMTGVRGKEKKVTKNFEVITVTSITQNSSVNFKWAGTEFDSLTDTTAVAGTGASEFLDLYTADGVTKMEDNICRVQYQSTESGTGYLLISDIDASKFPSSGISRRLVGASSGAHCLFTPTTGRYRQKLPGVKRTFKTQWGGEGTNDASRRKIAMLLSRAGVTGNDIVRGSFNIAQFPSYHVDNKMSGSASSTTVTWTAFKDTGVDCRKYGLKKSMPIGILNAAGTHFTHYNYVTDVSSTTATVASAPQNLAGGTDQFDNSQTIRFYVPIRAGDFIYVKNNIEKIAGNFLVTKVTYSESPGVQNTRLEVVGKDVAVAGKMPKVTFSNVSSDARGTDGDIVGKGKMAFSFPTDASNNKVKFSADDHKVISWTAGPLLLGNGEKYQITNSTTGDMVVYDPSSLANEVASTYYLYWAPDDPNVIRKVAQSGWEAVESDDTVYIGWARAASDLESTPAYKTTALAEVNIAGNTNADGNIMGTSQVITGSKIQTANSGAGRIVIEDDSIKIYDAVGTSHHISFLRDVNSDGSFTETGFMNFDNSSDFGGLGIVNYDTASDMDDIVIWANAGDVNIRGDTETTGVTVTSGGLRIQNASGASLSGDPAIRLTSGATGADNKWTIGADYDDSWKLKFDWATATVGAAEKMELDSSGNLEVAGTVTSSAGVLGVGTAALTGSTNNTVVTVTGANAIAGEANLTFDGTHLSSTGRITHSATTTNATGSYGTFRFTADPAGGANDVLAFTSGQTNATPASSNNDSAFWTMWTQAPDTDTSRLHFEPIDDWSTADGDSHNFAYIGYHNPLVSVMSYYHSAGAGSEAYASHTFYGDTDTGMYNISADILGFSTGGTLRVQVSSSGTTFSTIQTGTVAYDAFVTAGGLLKRVTSSERRKKDIIKLTTPSEKIYDLEPVNFTWKDTGEKDFGIIAERAYETIPELAVLDEEGRPDGVKYSLLSVLLLNEVKKLKQEIEELKENR